MTDQPEPWHLQRNIPIALIGAILMQTGAFGWFMSDLSARVDSAMNSNTQQDARLSAAEAALNAQNVSAATTAAQLSAVRDSLQELKDGVAETNRLLREQAAKP